MTARPRSDDKAQAILQAARRCISEKGYAAATIAEIAAEAGVSRGLLHYYFKSKEELLAQVVQVGTDAYVEPLVSMFARSESTDDLARELVVLTRTVVESDPAFLNLVLDCWTLGHESPLLARELEDLFRQIRDAVVDGLDEAAGRGIIKPAIALRPLASLLLAIMDGLGAQFHFLPELSGDERMWEALELGIRGLLGAGE
jgi:AcrR family transcriptional regulator